MKYLFYSLRPKQWIKNIFIFLPLIFGKQLFTFPANLRTAGAFCCSSLAASAAYLVNDIIDVKKDRHHPTERLRPIAAGKVSIKHAIFAALALGVLAVLLSFALDVYLGYIVVIYLLFNFAYSKVLKNTVIIDVFCIGVFFLLRIMAGSAAAKVDLSHWIIITTVLLALFLGFNKRRQELKLLERKATGHRHVLAKYDFHFIDQMIAVVASSTAIAYLLYTVDARTVSELGTKNMLLGVPFVYYGIFRYLYLIIKKNKDGDPTRILLSDRMTQINIILWFAVCAAVIYFGL